MPLPATNHPIIQVANETQHRRNGSNHSSITNNTPNTSTENKEGGDRLKAAIKTGFVVKNHIFPIHKFITSSEDLRFDMTTGGKTICAMYLDNVVMGVREEGKCRKLWEEARESIPMSLNTQQNNTNKAIRDITFKSKFSVQMHISYYRDKHIQLTLNSQLIRAVSTI